MRTTEPEDSASGNQPSLPLDAPPLPPGIPLLPARMVNEFVYCPRLAYLEWVQGEWADSADTVEGRASHKRVDKARGTPPKPKAYDATAGDEGEEERIHVRSLELSSDALGLIAKLDLAEFEGKRAVPVDYKRGKRPHVARGAYEPERVQLCVQGLLLEEHGYDAPEGVLYFVASKERVTVPFDDELRAVTRQAAAGLRLIASGGQIPPPLENSPKCPRCSLAAICLPDEVHYLRTQQTPPRPLAVGNAPALPMYVQARGAKVAKKGDVLEVSVDDEKVASARLMDVSQLVLQGGVYLTGPALHELMARDVPVTWLSHGGWFLGHTVGLGHKNVELRTAQFRASFDSARCLRLARDLVAAKIRNQRTLLRRNWKRGEMPEQLLSEFRQDIDAAERARDLSQLLGVEGNAAARYFKRFGAMLSAPDDSAGAGSEWPFDFERRTRREERARNAEQAALPTLTTDEKVAHFGRLFRGRTDVYPVRWESKTGKSGYSPACANEWRAGICEKPRIKCADCAHRQLVPLTDQTLYDHLAGRHTAGVYPLLADESCHFLAVDFDESDWQADALAFVQSCRSLGVPAALEVSRSGNGAHAWVFFSAGVAARDARRLGSALISHTCARTRQLKLTSYDRLFPNQDTLPKGGFGNLIALPLQKLPREHGGSVFVDDALRPHADQWAFLASVPTMAPHDIEPTILRATGGSHPLDVTFIDEEDQREPWKRASPAPQRLPGAMPASLTVTLANMLYFEKAPLPQALANRLIRLEALACQIRTGADGHADPA